MTKRAQSKLWTLQSWNDGSKRSYPEPINPPVVSGYRVLNNEVGYILQGYPVFNAGTIGTDSTVRANAAKADFIMLGAVNPSAFSAENSMIAAVRSIRSDVKIFKYTNPRYWYDGTTAASDSPYREGALTINLNGAPALWTAKNAAGQTLAHVWSPSNTNGINLAVPSSSTNAIGQTLPEAFKAQFMAMTQYTLYDGVMMDDSNTVPNNFVIRGTSTEVNWSYLQDGTDYNYLLDYTFGDAWRAGIRSLVETMRTISGTFAATINSGTAGAYAQYKSPFSWSAGGRPPTPFSSTSFYESVDWAFEENALSFRGFGFPSNGNYTIRSDYASLARDIFMTFELTRQMTRPSNDNRFGAQIANANQQMEISSGAANRQIDYDYARACWAMGRLVEGISYGNVRNPNQPMFLDETCIKLGAVVGGSRSMGTLNQPNISSNDPVSFTVRSPNTTNGSAQFFWAEFDNALVVWRGDNTGLTPGSSNFGDGTAVSYTLPSAGSGKKWQRPNASTYVNPDYSDLAMQAQNTALNNGADATTSSLKPLHGEVFLRVNS